MVRSSLVSLALLGLTQLGCGDGFASDGPADGAGSDSGHGGSVTAPGGAAGQMMPASGSGGAAGAGAGGSAQGGAGAGGNTVSEHGGAGGATTGGTGGSGTGGVAKGGSSGAGGSGGTGGEACATSTWFADADGDTFGDQAVSVEECTAPEGYVANADDCYDGNAEARPGPRPPFPPVEHEDDRGDGSWDYDCDGEETLSWTELGSCPDASTDPPTPGTVGWWESPVPDCGDSGFRKVNAASCPGALLSLVQQCK